MDAKILLIDGDRWMQRVVISALQDQDYRITTASDGFGGLALALADPPSLIISDIMMPGMSGGRLILSHPGTGRRCRVFLREGRIVGAFLDGDESQRHAELLYRVLHWSVGTFEFKSVPVEMRDDVGASTTHLLIEAWRRLDEAGRGESDCSLVDEGPR